MLSPYRPPVDAALTDPHDEVACPRAQAVGMVVSMRVRLLEGEPRDEQQLREMLDALRDLERLVLRHMPELPALPDRLRAVGGI